MTIDTPVVPGYFSKASNSFVGLDVSSEYQCVNNVSGHPPQVPQLDGSAVDSWAVGNSLTVTTLFDGNLIGNSIDVFSPKGYAEAPNLNMRKSSIEESTPQGITANDIVPESHTTLLPNHPSTRGCEGHMEQQGAYVSPTNRPLDPSNALDADRYLLDSCMRANSGDDGIFPSTMEQKFDVPYSTPNHGTNQNRWTSSVHTGQHTDNNLSGYISSGSGCEDLGQTDSFCEMFPSAIGNAIKPVATAMMDMIQQDDVVFVKSEDTASVGPILSIDYDEIQEIWRRLSSLGNPTKQDVDQILDAPDPTSKRNTSSDFAMDAPAAAAGNIYKRTRAEQLSRYREKKMRRATQPKIRYKLLKANADRRPRVKGRFVKKSELAASN